MIDTCGAAQSFMCVFVHVWKPSLLFHWLAFYELRIREVKYIIQPAISVNHMTEMEMRREERKRESPLRQVDDDTTLDQYL